MPEQPSPLRCCASLVPAAAAEWLAINSLTIITLIALWITQLLVFGLWGFHTWLAMTNTTTFELATGARKLW